MGRWNTDDIAAAYNLAMVWDDNTISELVGDSEGEGEIEGEGELARVGLIRALAVRDVGQQALREARAHAGEGRGGRRQRVGG